MYGAILVIEHYFSILILTTLGICQLAFIALEQQLQTVQLIIHWLFTSFPFQGDYNMTPDRHLG